MEIDYKEIILSSEYTEEDEAMSFVENGITYSCDGLRLLKVTANSSDKIIIRKDVLVICDEAFSNCMASEVVMPDSLVLIGEWAFDTSRLEIVTIPSNVIEIGSRAFSGCHQLKQVFFENVKVLKIGNYAFDGCHNLEPKCITEIEKQFGSRVFREVISKEGVSHSSSSGSLGSDYDSEMPYYVINDWAW